MTIPNSPAWDLRFRGGLAFNAHRLLHHSTLGLIVIKKKKDLRGGARLLDGQEDPLKGKLVAVRGELRRFENLLLL